MKRKPDPASLWDLDPAQSKLVEAMAKRGLESLFTFCVPRHSIDRGGGVKPFNEKTLQLAMRRFVAIAWLLHSSMLQGDELDAEGVPTGKLVPLTLEQLGKLEALSCTKVALSLLAKRFGEKFEFHGRIQKPATSKGNHGSYAKSAKTGWAKRRAREAAATA